MTKKKNGKTTGQLFLDLIDRFDDFRKEFLLKIDVLIKRIDEHDIILRGKDGRSGMVADVNYLITRHQTCPVDNIQKTIWMGMGAGIILNALLIVAMTIYLDNKYRHSEQTTISQNSAYAMPAPTPIHRRIK